PVTEVDAGDGGVADAAPPVTEVDAGDGGVADAAPPESTGCDGILPDVGGTVEPNEDLLEEVLELAHHLHDWPGSVEDRPLAPFEPRVIATGPLLLDPAYHAPLLNPASPQFLGIAVKSEKRWPQGVIPYVIEGFEEADRSKIEDSIVKWNNTLGS